MKIDSTEWYRLSSFPSCTSYKDMSQTCHDFWKMFTKGEHSGVYQVSLTKPTDLVHKDICYIGESGCLPKRISDLRTSAGKNNKVTHHMCGVYIREEDINIDSVYVRVLIADDKKGLERYLHNEHRNKFGYNIGYLWEEASGGYKSCRIQSQVNIQRLDSLEACLKVQNALTKRIKELKEKYEYSLTKFKF